MPMSTQGDFTTLGPEVMLSGIALSLTEEILPAQEEKTQPGLLSKGTTRIKRTKTSRPKVSTRKSSAGKGRRKGSRG